MIEEVAEEVERVSDTTKGHDTKPFTHPDLEHLGVLNCMGRVDGSIKVECILPVTVPREIARNVGHKLGAHVSKLPPHNNSGHVVP